MRRVVITGIGLLGPTGNGWEAFWQSLIEGRSGIGRITRFDPSAFAAQIAGEVKGFDVSQYLSPKEARRMDTFIHYGMAAGLQAWRDAGITVTPDNAERVGINFGSGIGGLPLIESMHDELVKSGPRRISPFFIPASIVNLAAGHVSIRYGAKGPNEATCTACTTSTHAIGDASRIIQRGDADVMIAGGTEAAITPMGVGGFAAMRAGRAFDERARRIRLAVARLRRAALRQWRRSGDPRGVVGREGRRHQRAGGADGNPGFPALALRAKRRAQASSGSSASPPSRNAAITCSVVSPDISRW